MITIKIDETTETKDQMAQALRVIADQIDKGIVRGYDPDWNFEGEEEKSLTENEIEEG